MKRILIVAFLILFGFSLIAAMPSHTNLERMPKPTLVPTQQYISCPNGYINYGVQTYSPNIPGQFYYGSSEALMIWVEGQASWWGGSYPSYSCSIDGARRTCILPTLTLSLEGSQYVNFLSGPNGAKFNYCQP